MFFLVILETHGKKDKRDFLEPVTKQGLTVTTKQQTIIDANCNYSQIST